ncbi:MAG: type II toxin-antitoxin system RelE/ParE family toxin [Bacteroidetes bacterium]|nr:type II toxin-antitoxin system RelE/ParE family toxin [Bacteroidota bacterium]
MYRVIIKKSAEKELAVLPLSAILDLKEKIIALGSNPFPHGFKKLKGFQNQYRIRSGNYRVIYKIEHKLLIIEILKIGDRKNIYG